MPKVDLDELEASLCYMDDWYKVLKELKAARDVVAQAELESMSRPPSEPMSRFLDRYIEVTKDGES